MSRKCSSIQAAAKRLRAAANERAANARETVDIAPDLATHGSSLGWRSAHVAAPTEVAAAADAPPANVNNLCQMPSPTVWKSNFARSMPST